MLYTLLGVGFGSIGAFVVGKIIGLRMWILRDRSIFVIVSLVGTVTGAFCGSIMDLSAVLQGQHPLIKL